MSDYRYKLLSNNTLVEVIKPTPRHRITGINAYKAKSQVINEWQRVQELRELDGLVRGGNRLEPGTNTYSN